MSTFICPICGQPHSDTTTHCTVTGKPLGRAAPAPVYATAPPTPEKSMTGMLPVQALLNNRYIILDKIGQGGMGAVYKATDMQSSGANLWAIKEMSESNLEPSERADSIQRFQQEANLLMHLNHPNIPRVVDYFFANERHYLVMEFVPGDTLATIINRHPQPFSDTEIWPWVKQLCQVLTYLHSQKPNPIIFRDLKPDNIMITPANQVKLIDFGIVRFFKLGKSGDTERLGTPGYSALEAYKGQTEPRSDLFSLCVVIHQLLTRYNPAKSFGQAFPLIRTLNPSVSPQWEQTINRGLQQNINQRWASVAEFRQQLQSVSGELPTVAAPPNPVSQNGGNYAAPVYQPISGPYAPQSYPGVQPPQPPPDYKPINNPYPIANNGGKDGAVGNHISRPSTRLITSAAKLSSAQLVMAGIGVSVATIIGLWITVPVLYSIPWLWNSLPMIALLPAFGYALSRRHWAAFAFQTLLGLVGGLTIWTRLNVGGEYSMAGLLFGLIFSGLFFEFWVFLLNHIRDPKDFNTWLIEMIWLSMGSIASTFIIYGMTYGIGAALNVLMWIGAFFLGCIGWFVGDVIQQSLYMRQNGFKMRT